MDEAEITIAKLNELKRDSDKWSRWAIALLIAVFLGPAVVILLTFLTSLSSGSFGKGIRPLMGGAFGFIMVLFFFFMIGAIVVFVIMASKRAKYREAYKKYFSHRVLSKMLKEYYLDHKAGIDRADLSNLGMVRLGNKYHSEDYVSGRYKDVGFAQADIVIQDEYKDSDGNTHTATFFQGQWMVFEFPRNFVAKLAVVGSGCRQAAAPRKMEKFATESTEFNKMFTVYMQDGLEMFYLLDPKMIELLQALGEKYNGRIMFLFVDKKLHIGINNGSDSFEPPKHKKGDLNEVDENGRLSAEFRTVFDFIDTLELSKNIFK